MDQPHTCAVCTPEQKHTFALNTEGTAQRSKGSSPHFTLIPSAEIMEILNGVLVFRGGNNQTPQLSVDNICFAYKCVSISKVHLHPKIFLNIACSYTRTEGQMHVQKKTHTSISMDLKTFTYKNN